MAEGIEVNPMFRQETDRSVIDSQNKIIEFSLERFISDICIGNKCFICGIDPSEAEFNDEHVIPQWILREHNLYGRKIGLLNNTNFRYDQFTVPCCKKCNSLMGEKIEKPVKEILNRINNSDKITVSDDDVLKLFVWFNLVFIKTHLKDKEIKFDLKSSNDSTKIGDFINWNTLHHIHCIARSFYTGAVVDPKSIGSFLFYKTKLLSFIDRFDFIDDYMSFTMLLRYNNVAFCISLDDAGLACRHFPPQFYKITLLDALSPIQIREIFARLTHIVRKLKSSHEFVGGITKEPPYIYILSVLITEVYELEEYNPEEIGNYLYYYCEQFIPKNLHNYNEFIDKLKKGNTTFLFDDDENFISDSMEWS